MFDGIMTCFAIVGLALLADDAADQPIGRSVFYSGRVQGVGFRATTAAISRDCAVVGWVKNLDVGRVQVVVEGPSQAVNDFLEAVRQRGKDNLKKEVVDEAAPTGKFKDFRVAY